MKTFLLFSLFFPLFLLAQPGGVAGSTLWLKANAATNTTVHGAAVSSWGSSSVAPSPASVTQATAVNQPLFQNGAGSLALNRFNYNPFILTDGVNDFLGATGSFNLGNGNTGFGFSAYQVVAYTSGVVSIEWKGPSGMAKLKGDGIYQINNETGTLGTNNQFSNATQFQAHMASIRGHKTALTSGRYNALSRPFGSNNQPNIAAQQISIARNNEGSEPMAGGFGEFIFFPSILSVADNLKVESYLGIKYGLTLGTTAAVSNYVTSGGTVTWVGTAAYQNNIIGIGRDDLSALNQRQSHNYDDTVRIYKGGLAATNIANASTFAANVSYIVAGATTGKMRNTAAANAEIPSPALASCLLTTRLEREWRITNTNCAETFNMDLKLNSTALPGSVNVADLRLLVDLDGDFANGGTSCYFNGDGTGVVISYANPVITISGIANAHIPINTTRFITIASINLATPLPIELLYFDAKLNDKNTVDLNWVTVSERENDYFSVEKSLDGATWQNIGTVDGAGNSIETNAYYLEDFYPVQGPNYYRLTQTDFNGISTTSDVRIVELIMDELSVYPNPAQDKLVLKGKDMGNKELLITTSLGQRISLEKNILTLDVIELNTATLANGLYHISVLGSDNEVKKVVVLH